MISGTGYRPRFDSMPQGGKTIVEVHLEPGDGCGPFMRVRHARRLMDSVKADTIRVPVFGRLVVANRYASLTTTCMMVATF
jgi:hypothetical protein